MTLKLIRSNYILTFVELLIFYYGLIAFKLVDYIPYVLFSGYMIFVISYTSLKKLSVYDPRDLYLFLTLIGFGIGYPFFYKNPTHLFFFNDSAYSPAFKFDNADLDFSFFLFLFSSLFFYLGTFVRFKLALIKFAIPVLNLKSITIMSTIIVIVFSLFRLYFKINLPGYNEIAFPFVGYIYNPGIYLVNFLIIFCLYLGFKSLKLNFVLISLIPATVNGLAMGLMGIKSGLIYNFIMILVLFQMLLKIGGLNVSRKVKYSLIFIGFFALIVIYIVYSFIGYYRLILMVNDYDLSQINFYDLILGFVNSFQDIDDNFSDSDNFAIFKRIAGINYLVPIVSYFKDGFFTTEVSLIRNIYDVYSVNPEMYLTNSILGVPKSVISTNAPGGIGALYIYGGFLYCALGMFIFGVLIMNLFLFIVKNVRHSDFFISLYVIILIQLFLPVILEGTIINFLKYNIASFIIGFILFYYLVNFIAFFQRVKLV